MPRDNEVKISNGRETRVISMRHPPTVGEHITIENEPWLVLSVSHTIPYRVPLDQFRAMQEDLNGMQEAV